jgi:hypothetical protein
VFEVLLQDVGDEIHLFEKLGVKQRDEIGRCGSQFLHYIFQKIEVILVGLRVALLRQQTFDDIIKFIRPAVDQRVDAEGRRSCDYWDFIYA